MFPHVKPTFIALLLVFQLLGFSCATAPGPDTIESPVSSSASKGDKQQTPSSSGKVADVDRFPDREEYLFMSKIKEALDNGKRVNSEQADRLIELVPDISYGRFLAGSIYLRNEDTDNARMQFIRSYELDQTNDHALSALGDIAFQNGDLTSADRYYFKAYEAAVTPLTANRLALLRIQGGYLESASDILSKTLSDYPKDTMTRNNLAIAMDMMGTTSEGINILAGDDIADSQLLQTRALLQMKEGRPDRAAMDLEAGFEEGGSDRKAILMGIADLQQGRLDQAEANFRSAIVALPSGYEGHLNLGLTLRRQGRFTEAEKAYKEGLIRVSHPDLHLNLGVLYELYRGEPSLALEQYRNYLKLEGPASDRVRGWVEYLEGVLEGP